MNTDSNQSMNWKTIFLRIASYLTLGITKVGKNVLSKVLTNFNKQEEGRITPLFFVLSVFLVI
jgi:hypothetical protein